ncbi:MULTISPECIES: non-homologous end-joining DNA ligase [Streptomyces]|uniref:DNA ligase (ATP) n=1 Tax=Streptomyces albus (strain ATCC 21838 / DSM 41398 / FERM P-419 / JCM 4703 / NBRC 107858) TaxID=1081613 RepID=A0A0B5F2W9_STRA4|nr:non-homologous end-joining DNA ligase [Streptomyces sp. SCSIO ZS0520]AJE85930.1 DNA polymerase LigD, ligase domain-containing protein [Streptomyces albus]AOU80233.1 DNA polymerase LigD, ligase domain-containing protein [Streptomyces albus]AYN35947.1 ATP-dependent DNA ligase [Streptomyces albus]
MNELLRALPEAQQRLLGVAPAPVESAASPMMAVLSDRRDFGSGWLFERKLDGVRTLATRDGDRVRLLSRTGRAVQGSYPEIAEAVAAQPGEALTLDGEIVAFAHGRTDFARLQRRMQLTDPRRARASGVAVTYYVFDLLRLDGIDLTRLPLRTRKSLLRRAVDFHPPIRFTPHRNQAGPAEFEAACARGWEGLIAKRAEGRYLRRRSPDWLKLKCGRGQELVIGGWTAAGGARTGFGALLLGHYEDGRLRYAGKVGTGFDHTALLRIRALLDELARPTSPFAGPVGERGAHWAEPVLVAEIGFTEWTRDGMLRHPRFLGLRTDKPAGEVVREHP